MAEEFSFDVVSKLDLQEVENAIHAVNKEIATRFDFKGSVSKVDWDKKESLLTVHSDDEYRLKSVMDIIQSRLIKRNVSIKALDYQSIEKAEGATVRQKIKMKQGIESEKAKQICKAIKEAKIKAHGSIQGEQVRVTSKSKDDLQAVMALLRAGDYGVPLQFDNYR